MRALVSVFTLVITTLLPTAAFAQADAENFVRENGALAIDILNDDTVSLEDKKHQFRTLIDEVIDVPRVTTYVLGNYAKAERNRYYASQADLDAAIDDFGAVFREYAIGVYEARLGEYGGELFEVTGSTIRKDNDYIVHSLVSGGNQNRPLEVNWRVLRRDGALRVVDVEVFDVWLAGQQREEIVGFIRRGRGDISVATAALNQVLADREAELAAQQTSTEG